MITWLPELDLHVQQVQRELHRKWGLTSIINCPICETNPIQKNVKNGVLRGEPSCKFDVILSKPTYDPNQRSEVLQPRPEALVQISTFGLTIGHYPR
jgi:hypothetical protein